jgi:hypothetical protein
VHSHGGSCFVLFLRCGLQSEFLPSWGESQCNCSSGGDSPKGGSYLPRSSQLALLSSDVSCLIWCGLLPCWCFPGTSRYALWPNALVTCTHAGSSKLAGTALTLLGGLAPWYFKMSKRAAPRKQHSSLLHIYPGVADGMSAYLRSNSSPVTQDPMGQGAGQEQLGQGAAADGQLQIGSNETLRVPSSLTDIACSGGPMQSVLFAVQHAVKSPDEKLSRNGATTLQRLCAHEGLARHLLAKHGPWVDSLVVVYQERGGMQQRAGPHEDTSTKELLLVTLCRLACLSSSEKQLLLRLSETHVRQVQKALSDLAAASSSGGGGGGMGRSSSGGLSPAIFGATSGILCAPLVAQTSAALEVLTVVMESCRLGGGDTKKGAGKESASTLQQFCVAPAGTTQSMREQVLELMRTVWEALRDYLKPELLQGAGNADVATSVAAFMAAGMVRLLPSAPADGRGAAAAAAARAAAAAAGGVGAAAAASVSAQMSLVAEDPAEAALAAEPAVNSSRFLSQPLFWALQVLESLPVLMLSMPKIADLLITCLDALMVMQQQELQQQREREQERELREMGSGLQAMGLRDGDAGLIGDFSMCGGRGSGGGGGMGAGDGAAAAAAAAPDPAGAAAAAAESAASVARQAALLAAVCSSAVVAGCVNLVDQVLGPQMESAHVTLLLRLCQRCILCLPSCLVLWTSTLDLLLLATVVSCYSHDMEQCRAAMDWCQSLCTQPFAALSPSSQPSVLSGIPGRPTATSTSTSTITTTLGGSSTVPAHLPPSDQVAHAQLQIWLEGTAGAQVIQALLLACAGSMPSCLILPLSTVLHRILRVIGAERCELCVWVCVGVGVSFVTPLETNT